MPANNRSSVLNQIASTGGDATLSHINPQEALLLNSLGGVQLENDPMLASQGRNGDELLAYLSPSQSDLLHNMGGSGTINPNTGLPEYGFFGDLYDNTIG